MRDVFCISGLGADERIFKNLHVEGVNFHHIKWLTPEKDETIQHYAQRLAEQIFSPQPILLGVSFGGMLAIEISKIILVDKIILISSIKSYTELPNWMKRCGKLKLDKLIPKKQIGSIKPLKVIRPIQDYFLGAQTPEEKKIANEYRDTVDPVYLKWSINQILNWKCDCTSTKLFHLHGDNDHIFPIKKVKPTHIISKGGHLMVMSRCEEINKILQSIL